MPSSSRPPGESVVAGTRSSHHSDGARGWTWSPVSHLQARRTIIDEMTGNAAAIIENSHLGAFVLTATDSKRTARMEGASGRTPTERLNTEPTCLVQRLERRDRRDKKLGVW